MATPEQLQNGAIDPTVSIPKHVLEQAAASDALHKQIYQGELPLYQGELPPTPVEPQPPTTAQPVPYPEPQPAPEPQPPAQHEAPPAPQPAIVAAEDADEASQTWKHRYLSMKGRWEASQRQLGSANEINQQLAGELQATQSILSSRAQPPSATNSPHSDISHNKLITPEDVETYGSELIDTVQRAAREAVQPELDALKGENAELKKRVISTGQRDVQQALARDIPNWVAINRSPQFNQWLALRNIYTNQVRREMLNSAYQAANAPMVLAIFREFITEVKATGAQLPTSQTQQQPNPDPVRTLAPRNPAMTLEALAAPGRARPAPGEAQVPAEKPTYSRAQISKNYADKRRGMWAGRDNDWNMLEADMIAAGVEGRIR